MNQSKIIITAFLFLITVGAYAQTSLFDQQMQSDSRKSRDNMLHWTLGWLMIGGYCNIERCYHKTYYS